MPNDWEELSSDLLIYQLVKAIKAVEDLFLRALRALVGPMGSFPKTPRTPTLRARSVWEEQSSDLTFVIFTDFRLLSHPR